MKDKNRTKGITINELFRKFIKENKPYATFRVFDEESNKMYGFTVVFHGPINNKK